MRLTYFFCIAAVLLLAACKKPAQINFNCNLSGNLTTSTAIIGNAVTSFDAIASQPEPTFEINMNGPGGSSVNLIWYNLDSVNAEKNITDRTYTMPNRSAGLLAPFSVGAVYVPAGGNVSGVAYSTGSGSGGTITITGNSGPGGTISGGFSFTAINPYYPFDTVRVTNGTFTNVPVATQ